ncbi:hypothetical protein ACQJBY_015706 [Aegilops geniculata]
MCLSDPLSIPLRPSPLCLEIELGLDGVTAFVVVVTAATVVALAREDVQEIRSCRLRVPRAPNQAKAAHTPAIADVFTAYIAILPHRLPQLRTVPGLPDLTIEFAMLESRSQTPPSTTILTTSRVTTMCRPPTTTGSSLGGSQAGGLHLFRSVSQFVLAFLRHTCLLMSVLRYCCFR